MAFGDDQERTEAATPRRRQKAREEGQIVQSTEVVPTVLFLGNVLFFAFAGASLFQQIVVLMHDGLYTLADIELSPASLALVLREYLTRLALIVMPLFLMMLALGVVSHLLQTGLFFSPHGLSLQWSRINPAQGLQRLFSLHGLLDLGKSLLKLGLVGYVGVKTLTSEVEQFLTLSSQSVPDILHAIGTSCLRLCTYTGYAMLAIALLDYLWKRWEHEKNLRMSKQEVKEEQEQDEGDPQIKARIRGIMRDMARRRMMQDVPKADVIITNPTHLAVALCYRSQEMAAPCVLAKGAGHIAERIKALAREHDIPVVENKPVAQALFNMVEIGEPIPEALYKAVAEILAYVYRMKKSAG